MSDNPTSVFSYTDRDYLSLRDQITKYIRARIPEWVPGENLADGTLSDPSDFATVFVEAMAYVGDVMSYYVDRAAQESNILSATSPANVLAWAEMFGYVPALARSSEVVLTLTTANPEGVKVPNHLSVRGATDVPFSFEVQLPYDSVLNAVPPYVTVTPEHPLVVPAWEGHTKVTDGEEGYELGISNGTPGQSFVLPDLAVDSRDLWIEVLNYTDEISDDTGKWSFTYQLLEADAEDEVFTARVRSDGKLYVVFGDGQSGRIPPSGFTVRAHYRTTIGASASGITNVPPNSLTIIDGSWDVASYASLSDLAITNEAASYGGVDADSLATTRSNTVALTRSQRRAVTARDYEAVALSEGEVLTAYCSAKVWSRPTVWIFPRAPYVLEDATATNDLVSRVQATVDSMAMVGSSVDILMGTPTPLSLTLTVYTWPTLRQSVVKNAIINAITSQYTYENLRFEEGVTEDGILYTISRTVPFRLVRYVVADLVPVFGTQPLDSEVGEPKRYLPQPGELLYIDTDHLTVNIVGGINDLGA